MGTRVDLPSLPQFRPALRADAAPRGVIYSYERVWHPVHPALKDQGPYLVVLVELPQADGVRLVGNLLGDPRAQVDDRRERDRRIRTPRRRDPPFTLLQWARAT